MRVRWSSLLVVAILAPACPSGSSGPSLHFKLLLPKVASSGVSIHPSFTWSKSAAASSYQLQVSADPDFNVVLIDRPGLLTQQDTPPTSLAAGKTYYWRVYAVDASKSVLAAGSPSSFGTLPLPESFSLQSPADWDVDASTTPLLNWTASTGAVSYTVQIATDTLFTGLVVDQGGITSTSFTPLVPLPPTKTLYWRVLAVNGSGSTTATDAPRSFTTLPPRPVLFIAEMNAVGVRELFVSDGMGGVLNLSGPLVPGGNVRYMRPSPDGQLVAFAADKDTDGVLELYVVPISGGTPVKVSRPMVAGGNLTFFAFYWSADSSRILYHADGDVDEQFELYVAHRDGAPAVRLIPTMTAGGDVPEDQFGWALNDDAVVYLADQNTDDVFEVFSVPAAGGLPTNLTQSVGPDAAATRVAVSGNGNLVGFFAKQNPAAALQLYVTPAGGGPATQLSGNLPGGVRDRFIWSPNSVMIAFLEGNDFYTVKANGTERTRVSVLSPVMPGSMLWMGDSQYVLYLSFSPIGAASFTAIPGVAGSEIHIAGFDVDPAPQGIQLCIRGGGLFLTTANVPGPGTQIAAPPAWQVNYRALMWSPDATRILYAADEDMDDVEELFVVTTGGARVKVSGTLLESGISAMGWSSDGRRVFFAACKDTPGTQDLYTTGARGGPITRLTPGMIAGGKILSILPLSPPSDPPLAGPTAPLLRSGGSTFENLTAVGSTLYFTFNDGVHGEELWKSDGTVTGTVQVQDICPGPVSSRPCNLTAVGNVLLFMADDGVHGMEIWRSDGTAAGTQLVLDVFDGAGDGAVPIIGFGSRAVFQSSLFYIGTDGGAQKGLWRSDGTAAGTTFVSPIAPGGGSIGLPFFAVLGDTLFVLANDPVHGEELWKSDGTPAGTTLVKEIGPAAAGCNPANLTAGATAVYFTAFDSINGNRLWKSDGTETGTSIVSLGPGNPQFLTAAGPYVYFFATGLTTSMWQTDGTDAGTFEVQPSPAESFSGFLPTPGGWAALGGTLFFKAVDGIFGAELWKTDGTLLGTVRVKDINPGNPDSWLGLLTPAPATMFFVAQDGVHGVEVWKSDGSAAGTVQIADILPGPGTSSPGHLTAVGSTLYWVANDGLGLALWRSVP